jgi:hypothetical protein
VFGRIVPWRIAISYAAITENLGDNRTFDFWLAACQVNVTANGIYKFVCGGDWLWNIFDVIIVALQPAPHRSRCTQQGGAHQISVE